MINTNEHNYQNIRTLESKFEIIRNANQTNITRVDREIKRRDEEIRVGMKEMGTDIVKKFEGEVKELNELMKNQLKNMNTQILDFSKSIFEQEKKVVRVLRELPIKDQKDQETFQELRELINTNDHNLHERIDMLVEENFTIPEIILDTS